MNALKERPAKALEPMDVVGQDSKRQISEMILSMPLFQDLQPKEVDLLGRFVKLCRVRENSVIFEEGEEADFMGLIVEGLAELSKENSGHAWVKIGSEGSGRTLGEMALVDGERRSATAKFVQSGTVLLLTRESFNQILSQHPQLGVSILHRLCRMLSQRLRRTTGILSDYLK